MSVDLGQGGDETAVPATKERVSGARARTFYPFAVERVVLSIYSTVYIYPVRVSHL